MATAGTTAAMLGVGVYLWVIHSQKLPLARVSIAFGLVAVLLQRQRVRFPAPWLWFAAFTMWAFVGGALSQHQDLAVEGALEYARLALIFLVISNCAHNQRQLRTFMVIWLGVFALYPVRGTLFNLVFGIAPQGRYAWNFIFSNPNDLAALTLPVFAMSAALIPMSTGWTRRAAQAGVALLPGVIITTQSRGGIIALAVMISLIGLDLLRRHWSPSDHSRHRRARAVSALVVASLTVATIVTLAPEGVWERLKGLRGLTDTTNLRNVDREGSAEQRFEIWRVSWAIAADNPLVGVGARAYPGAHARYALSSEFKPIARGERDTHSTYFNTLAESGYIGLLLLLGMLVSAYRTMSRSVHTNPLAAPIFIPLRAGLTGLLVASIFATIQHLPFLYLYLGLISVTAWLCRSGGLSTATPGHPPAGRL